LDGKSRRGREKGNVRGMEGRGQREHPQTFIWINAFDKKVVVADKFSLALAATIIVICNFPWLSLQSLNLV